MGIWNLFGRNGRTCNISRADLFIIRYPNPLEDPSETGGLVITFELPDQSSLLADFLLRILEKSQQVTASLVVFIEFNSDVSCLMHVLMNLTLVVFMHLTRNFGCFDAWGEVVVVVPLAALQEKTCFSRRGLGKCWNFRHDLKQPEETPSTRQMSLKCPEFNSH